jgi:hypothetical protein
MVVEQEQDQQEQQQDQPPVREAPTRRRVQSCVGADVLNQRGAQDDDSMF